MPTKRIKKLSAADLSVFCAQIALFLHAGISLSEGLELMKEDVGGRQLQRGVFPISQYVHERKNLSEAMEKCGMFPEYLIKMTVIGEVSGNLEDVMACLSGFYQREQRLKDRIRQAVLYPFILIIMMGAVVSLIVTRVLPMLGDILTSLGGEMPRTVLWLMDAGRFITGNYILILFVVFWLFLVYFIYGKTPSGKLTIDKCKVASPLLCGIYKKITALRFAGAMTFLTGSNVNIEMSLDMIGDIFGNMYISNKLNECRKDIKPGETVYEMLHRSRIFPKKFSRMLCIGFRSGNADDVMESLADTYEQEVYKALGRIADSIEPVFSIFLSLIVGIILISVMLPLIRIMSLIG